MNKENLKHNNDFYSLKANFSLLNSIELSKLKKLKYLVYKIDTTNNTFFEQTIYKGFVNMKKIIGFDAIIKYELKNDEIINPFVNIYVPTLFMDYIRFAYKDSLFCHLDKLEINDIKRLSNEIYYMFNTQNKDYTEEDYYKIKNEYNLDFNSTYKDRIMVLHNYVKTKQSICPFYFWMAIMHDASPFIKYMGKFKVLSNKEINEKDIFFKDPDKK